MIACFSQELTYLMSLLQAILADGRWLIRAITSLVSLLLADAAHTSELTSDGFVGALLLCVARRGQFNVPKACEDIQMLAVEESGIWTLKDIRGRKDSQTYPSSPQLKHVRGFTGLGQSPRMWLVNS